MNELITGLPNVPMLCNLECILMPNGEILSMGRHVGWFPQCEGLLREINGN